MLYELKRDVPCSKAFTVPVLCNPIVNENIVHHALERYNKMFMKQKPRCTETNRAPLNIIHLSETLDLLCTNDLQGYCHGYKFEGVGKKDGLFCLLAFCIWNHFAGNFTSELLHLTLLMPIEEKHWHCALMHEASFKVCCHINCDSHSCALCL